MVRGLTLKGVRGERIDPTLAKEDVNDIVGVVTAELWRLPPKFPYWNPKALLQHFREVRAERIKFVERLPDGAVQVFTEVDVAPPLQPFHGRQFTLRRQGKRWQIASFGFWIS